MHFVACVQRLDGQSVYGGFGIKCLGPCAVWGRAQGNPARETMAAQALLQVLGQARFIIAKVVDAASNIDQQPLWWVNHAGRAIPFAPVRQPAKQCDVRRWIMVKYREIRHAGTGIGQCHARA